MSEVVVIIGANSEIGRAIAYELAKRRCALVLAGRKSSQLKKTAADLHIRYDIDVSTEVFDALDFGRYADFVDKFAVRFTGGMLGIIACYGYMGEQVKSQMDLAEARCVLDTNFTSTVLLTNLFANLLEERGRGYIAVISSVAGDRGRQSNYIYGASKGGLNVYLEGLRNRLARAGVNVLTVKPGFVDTPMTEGLRCPAFLVASAERVARDIVKAIEEQRATVYTPWFWWGIMKIVRGIPESIFKKLRL